MKTKLAAAVIAFGLSAPAMAAFTVNISEVNGNVVANGSGTINTADLTFTGLFVGPTLITPNLGILKLGALNPNMLSGASGPTSIGTAGFISASSSTGDAVGISGGLSNILVPVGYASMAPLTGSATWNGATFASLGITPGTYEWTWGSGATADKFTLQIGPLATPVATTSIPTLSEWGLIGLSSILAMFGLSRMRRRQR